MDPAAMVNIFQRSETLHDTRYVNFNDYGDLKTYKRNKSVSYKVNKKEYIIHT